MTAFASLAADYTQNAFTLVYDGAITKNEPGKVNIHPVTYKLNGLDIVANVYTPADYDRSQQYPAIVVAHPNGGVKEQVAGLFAQHLAEQGYITITADAAYQGGGDGQPRSGTNRQTASRTSTGWRISSLAIQAWMPSVWAAGHLRRRWLRVVRGQNRQAIQVDRDAEHVQLRAGSPQWLREFATGHDPAAPVAGFKCPRPGNGWRRMSALERQQARLHDCENAKCALRPLRRSVDPRTCPVLRSSVDS